MKFSIWDLLSLLLLAATVIVLVLVIQVFSDPYSSLNPFPPPTLPSRLVLPTYTNTPMRMPSTWTPTAKGPGTATEQTPSGLKPTWTLLPTRTGFVVNTWTPTATHTFTPTITRTPTNTKPPTNTPIPFAVTSVLMSVDNSAFTGPCPPGHVFTFLAGIVTNTGGDVKYHWEFSDGNNGPVTNLNFGAGGTQSVSTTWNITSTFTGWARIYIDEPNHQAFGQQGFAMTCSP